MRTAPAVSQGTSSSASPAVPRPAPVASRPVSGNGISLKRGEKFNIAETNGKIPANLRIAFHWNVRDNRCDLDASAFMLNQQEKVSGDEWFIFYGQPVSPDNSLEYSGNTGAGAEMQIHLQRVSPSVQKIALAVTIYEAFERKLHFGMVQSLDASIINADTGRELAHFALTDCSPSVTAMVIGELYRYKGAWKFNAVGSGVYRDLAGFCGMYGIETG